MNGTSKLKNKIVFLGNQKSGTSAISTLFAKAIGEEGQIDIPVLWPPVPSKILRGETNFGDIIQHNQKYFSAKIIKEPNLTFIFSKIDAYFENCKYVFILREPKDNIRSILNRLKIKGNFNSKTWHELELNELEKAIIDPTRLNQSYSHYIEVLADRWKIATDLYLNNTERFHLVRYDDFMKNKEKFVYNLARLLNERIANSISSELDFHYQPPGRKVRNYRWFFGKRNLKAINLICQYNFSKIETHLKAQTSDQNPSKTKFDWLKKWT